MRSLISVMVLSSGLAWWGCGTADSDTGSRQSDSGSDVKVPALGGDSARLITLPTPMQIPALLRNVRAPYNQKAVLPIKNQQRSFFKASVLFGMHMVDLAYSGSYGDRQTALNKFTYCRQLADDMRIRTEAHQAFYNRFERNTDRPDSLGRIILEFYDAGHRAAQLGESEGVGLVIIMGCLFEGLHMAFEQARKHDLLLFYHLLNQQKLYAANLIYSFERYEIPLEISREHELLIESYELLKALQIPSIYDFKNGKAEIRNVNPELLKQLEDACSQFRETAQM